MMLSVFFLSGCQAKRLSVGEILGWWQIVYSDSQGKHYGEIKIRKIYEDEKGSTFTTLDKVKHPRNINLEGYLFLTPDITTYRPDLKVDEDYIMLHGASINGGGYFDGKKLVAHISEVIHAFSSRDVYLEVSSPDMLKGEFKGSFLRPLEVPSHKRERVHESGPETWTRKK